MTMHAIDLRELIVRRLVREHGGSAIRWRRVIGDLRLYPRATHPHCNWDARPSGAVGDVAAVERMIDALRSDHPFIEA